MRTSRLPRRFALLLLLLSLPLLGQANTGELRLTVTDPSGLGVQASVHLACAAVQYRATLETNQHGALNVPLLPYGIYQVEVEQPGFAPLVHLVAIRTSVPTPLVLRLALATASATVTVKAPPPPLVNPEQPGAVAHVGSATIQNRLSSIPGRSLQDLIVTQPGWLYEGNAMLHPRGSQYQTQFVIDGVPIQNNSSPGSGPAIEANDVSSLSVYTAGIPAQYGDNLGGVVVVNTLENTRAGFHGRAVVSGGSFATRSGFFSGEYTAGANTLGFSLDGSGSGHYLNPVVPQNYTNKGTTGDFAASFEHRFASGDRLDASVRHELSRFELPNEQIQQAAGQLQNGNNFETMGIVSYEHILSSHAVADVHAMLRNNSNNYYSNPASTPVIVTQHNYFNEGYVNGSLTVDSGPQEWKVGFDSDNTFLHENFAYDITDPSQFTPGTAPTFGFVGQHPELEQGAYVQDLIHLGVWTVDAGLRWDHYQLLLNQQAVSPRLSISRYFPGADMTLHVSYDRAFEPPATSNILLSSSTAVDSIDPGSFLRLPVQPSLGNYYEGGMSKSLFGKMSLTVNYYRRDFTNYADDNQIDNTTISFPIAFRKAVIYGAEAELTLPVWGRFSSDLSYSYMVGNAWYPVTGGLFLGSAASSALTQTSGHFPDSQDQRNTFSGRVRYQLTPRVWVAGGVQYDSGLPFQFNGTYASALAQYGPAVLSRINFPRGRIYPTTQFNASVGATVYQSERYTTTLQADGENLSNALDVIDFGGLFSGNAIGPGRSFYVRLQTNF